MQKNTGHNDGKVVSLPENLLWKASVVCHPPWLEGLEMWLGFDFVNIVVQRLVVPPHCNEVGMELRFWGLGSVFLKSACSSHICVFFQVLWYCWERLQQPCNLSARDADRGSSGWKFRWMPPSSLYNLETKITKSKPMCLMFSHAARTVVSAKFKYSHFQKSNRPRVAVSSLSFTTIYLLFNALKAVRGRSSCAGTGSGCNCHCVGTWVFVSKCVTHTYTLPFLSASCMTTPKSQPQREIKEKEKLTWGRVRQ